MHFPSVKYNRNPIALTFLQLAPEQQQKLSFANLMKKFFFSVFVPRYCCGDEAMRTK